ICDPPGEFPREVTRRDLVRKSGLETQRRIARAQRLRRDVVGGGDRDPQGLREAFREVLQAIEIERVRAGANAEKHRRFEMIEMARRAADLENGHDRGDPRAAGNAQDRALLLGREDRLAERAEPIDSLTAPRSGEQPVRKCPVALALDDELRPRSGAWMVD